jgi:hypothetical protein
MTTPTVRETTITREGCRKDRIMPEPMTLPDGLTDQERDLLVWIGDAPVYSDARIGLMAATEYADEMADGEAVDAYGFLRLALDFYHDRHKRPERAVD